MPFSKPTRSAIVASHSRTTSFPIDHPIMPDDDAYRSRLQATITSLRYWVPAVSDAARVEESEADGAWQLSVRPLFKAACPFSLTLSVDGTYRLCVDGVTYPDRPVNSLDVFLPMAEAISEGRVVHRRWVSPNTGIETQIETIVDLGNGNVWSAVRRLSAADGLADIEDGIRQDQHFLPYRRR